MFWDTFSRAYAGLAPFLWATAFTLQSCETFVDIYLLLANESNGGLFQSAMWKYTHV